MKPGQNALAVVLPLFVCSLAAHAQFRIDTDLQSIPVQVTDSKGNYVPGLSAADFTLLENGHPQKIAFFGAAREPVSLAILLDSSRSMDSGGKLARARALLGTLLRRDRSDDEIFLVPFTDRVEAFERLTKDQRLNPPAIGISSPGRGTALYDALATALCRLKDAQNVRQAVVVVTDGADQDSRLNLDRLIRLAQISNPQIFIIGFFDKAESEVYRSRQKTVTLVGEREINNPLLVFERLAKESGAESFFPTSDRDLERALDRISSVLEGQYTLAYYPQHVDRLRRIEVRVKRRGVKVATRRSVGADRAGAPVHFTAGTCEVSPKEHPYPWESRTAVDASGAMTYREDFSDSHSGWPNRAEQVSIAPQRARASSAPSFYRPGLRYTARGYEIAFHPPRGMVFEGHSGAGGVIVAYGPSWRDFRASVNVETNWGRTLTSPDNLFATAAGMIFHMGEDGYYAFFVTGSKAKQIKFTFLKNWWNGKQTQIVPWTVASLPDDSAVTTDVRKIAVEYKRGQIALFLNDRDLTTRRVEDHTFESGLVGFGVFGDGRVDYRNLIVQRLQ